MPAHLSSKRVASLLLASRDIYIYKYIDMCIFLTISTSQCIDVGLFFFPPFLPTSYT